MRTALSGYNNPLYKAGPYNPQSDNVKHNLSCIERKGVGITGTATFSQLNSASKHFGGKCRHSDFKRQ